MLSSVNNTRIQGNWFEMWTLCRGLTYSSTMSHLNINVPVLHLKRRNFSKNRNNSAIQCYILIHPENIKNLNLIETSAKYSLRKLFYLAHIYDRVWSHYKYGRHLILQNEKIEMLQNCTHQFLFWQRRTWNFRRWRFKKGFIRQSEIYLVKNIQLHVLGFISSAPWFFLIGKCILE